MIRHQSSIAIFNLISRALTLVFRFLLSFYITKILGFEQAGVYGLCLGAVAITPSIVGWGLNYFVSRDVVGQTRSDAFGLVSDRLVVTLTSLTLVTAAISVASIAWGHRFTATEVQICALIWLETIALDIHMPLIGMNQSVQANVLVFVRTASWIPPCIAASLLWDPLRSLSTVFNFWICANFTAIGLTFYMFRDFSIRNVLSFSVDRIRKLFAAYRTGLIYLSDIGLVGSIFLDRYVITFILGIEPAGIYFFYWSFTSAVQTLVSTAVVQVALPKLVGASKRGDLAAWQAVLFREFVRASTISVVFLVATYCAASILIDAVSVHRTEAGNALLILLSAAALFRVGSDVINLALASVDRDGTFAYLNLVSCLLSVGCAYVGAVSFSLVGVGWGVAVSTGTMLAIRIWIMSALIRQLNPAQ